MFPPPQGFFPPFGGGPPPSFPPSGQQSKQDFAQGDRDAGPSADGPDRRFGGRDNSYWKSKVCYAWQNKGHCSLGDRCKFAHGPHDMRSAPGPGRGPPLGPNKRKFSDEQNDFDEQPPRHNSPFDRNRSSGFPAPDPPQSNEERDRNDLALKDLFWKTRLCRQFIETNYCNYGDRCTYAHGKHELRPGFQDKAGKPSGFSTGPAGPGPPMGPGGVSRGPGPVMDAVGPIRGPGLGPNPNKAAIGGPLPGSMSNPNAPPAPANRNPPGPGPPPGDHPSHMDPFRSGSGWMGPRGPIPAKPGQGPMPPAPQGPPGGGPPPPMPPSHQNQNPTAGPPPLGMPPGQGPIPGPAAPPGAPKGAEVTFVDRVRAVCALLNIGNSVAASKEKPHAVHAAVSAIHNGSVFKENPFADSVERYL